MNQHDFTSKIYFGWDFLLILEKQGHNNNKYFIIIYIIYCYMYTHCIIKYVYNSATVGYYMQLQDKDNIHSFIHDMYSMYTRTYSIINQTPPKLPRRVLFLLFLKCRRSLCDVLFHGGVLLGRTRVVILLKMQIKKIINELWNFFLNAGTV